jgi:tetratricopeptide (TPR) repeat protein
VLLRASCILVFFLAACGSHPPLPPLPELSTASFGPAIRQAVDRALAGAKAHPNDAGAVGRLGMVLHAHDQRVTAKICYQRASLLDPDTFDWHYYRGLVSDAPAAADAFRAALRLRDYLPAKIKLGEALLAAGDSAGAKQILEGIHHPAALFSYGRATGDHAYYEKALRVFPQFGAAMFALSRHYARTGRAGDAARLMAEYERHKLTAPPLDDPLLDAVRALNRGPDRLLSQAAHAEAQGQLGAAVELQHQALALDPKLVQAHVNLISLYGRLGDTPNAEKHYREAIALQPNGADAYYNFGVLCYRLNRRAAAQAAFTKALEINPGHADAHNNLGVLLEQQGKLEEAARHFRNAIELRPDLRLARYHLGRIRANQGHYAEAIAQFQEAVTVDDEATPTYLYALGAAFARSGNSAQAAEVLEQARARASAHGQAGLAASIQRDLARLKR